MSSGAPAGSQPPRLPERYRLSRHIASGGMASVWCAEDRLLDRTVAIKILAERFAHDQLAVRRFKREARAAARVCGHNHVVTVFDVGDTEPADDPADAGRAFIVMEYLAGGTVADAIRVGAVRRHETLRWLAEAASALDHAHGCGIVHRDIKPANFLLDRSRILHVADFGIARLVSEDTITSSGELFGTAAYLAPEQALGRAATSASDRYALAVAAFELLVGERPFAATHFAAQARQHVEDEPPSASERDRRLPAAVDPILQRGMAKDPDARFATAGELVASLQRTLSEVTASTPRRVAAAPPRVAAAPPRVAAAPPRVAATPPRVAAAPQRVAPAPRPPSRAPTRRLPSAVPPRRAALTEPVRAGADPARPGHRGRAVALAALALVVVGVVAVAVAARGGGSTRHSASSAQARVTHAAASPPRHRSAPKHTPKATTSPSARASSTTSTSTTTTATAAPSGAQLQQTGHNELESGDYQTAIGTLRQAISASDPGSLTYAYALYDLGRALVLGGDPSGAIPVLQQRLKIPNQTGVVRQMLNQALRAAGQAPTPTPTTPRSKNPGSGTSKDHNRGHAGPTGGAGIGPAPSHGQRRAAGHVSDHVSVSFAD